MAEYIMFIWTPYPFLRIIAAFILGILVAKFEFIRESVITHQLLILGSVVFTFLLIWVSKIPNRLIIAGNLGLIIVMLVAVIRFDNYREINNPNHIIHIGKEIDGYVAEVNSACVVKEKYFIYEVDIVKVLISNAFEDKQGKVHLYIRRESQLAKPLKYGDRIALHQSPFRLPPPKNPHEFNYMEYMAGRNIYYQQFVDVSDVGIIAHGSPYSIMAWCINLRNHFGGLIEKYVDGEQETAIAKALILGIRDGLDQETKRSYSASGAMHVLAVSGLHVGIIIIIVSFLLRPISKGKTGKIISSGISIVFLWIFACVTGLSPSILRAVTMFSIIIVGQTFYSRPSIYNSLALSAFVLLFYNPNFLFSVGFQLSYIAVLGIVYIYPLIHNAITFDNWLLEKTWAITCLSIAAQLATFPLTLYYFHQFPVYFLISNLVVIPAAFLIMSIGIALIALGFTPLASFIGMALQKLIFSLNTVVSFIEKLDFSLIDWLYLSPSQTISIYLMIVFSFALMYFRKFRFLYVLTLLALIISAIGTWSLLIQSETRKLTFYEIGGESVLDRIEGLNSELINIKTINNMELVRYQVEPNRLNSHLRKIEVDSLSNSLKPSKYDGLAYYFWKGEKFVFVQEPMEHIDFNNKVETDYLVISNNATVDTDFIMENFQFDKIIVDSSNDYRTCRFFERFAEKYHLKCRILRNEGALTIALTSLNQ
ncbi:ComEC/Rec2 family competence protein [Reichenbachiella sp. MALMAid0571]|uniref:ComEC/Rec2 family competence protein n=1 Tax=Reichenbachiella sp. MALMAid0571 TaxID=3143939 RepID=UPI0032DFDF53